MSGRLYVGMRGAFATLSIDVGPLSGVDLSLAAKTLELRIRSQTSGAHDLTITDWAWSVTSGVARATYVPDGSEFTTEDEVTISGTATINGQPLDLVAWPERIFPNS